MEKSNEIGMQTFDQSLYKLYHDGMISSEEALANADSRTNLQLKMRLSGGAKKENTTEDISVGDVQFKRK
jgi:twitching motility protein PilU